MCILWIVGVDLKADDWLACVSKLESGFIRMRNENAKGGVKKMDCFTVVTYLEIRDELSEEEEAYIKAEIEKYQEMFAIKKDGNRYYYKNTCHPVLGMKEGVLFGIKLRDKKYKKYLKKCLYNDYFSRDIHVKDPVLEYCVSEGIRWHPVEEGYPDSSRQVLCTYKGKDDYEIGAVQYRILTGQELLEHPKMGGFGNRHEEVIAWAEMPTPFDPENGKEEFRELQREQSIKRWFVPQNRRK